jgi:FMN phosphatase YigB (HAD superfamily)
MHVVLQRLDLARYFDIIVVSDVVGLTKPDPEIYRFTLDRAGVATRAGSRPVLAAGSVFVDDLEENVAAAESVGMRGVLIDRQNRLPDAPHPRITNLDQILTFLGAAAGT